MLGFCDTRLSVRGAQKYHRSSALLKNDLLSEKSRVLGAWVRAPGSLNPMSPKPMGSDLECERQDFLRASIEGPLPPPPLLPKLGPKP